MAEQQGELGADASLDAPWERFRRAMPIAKRWAFFDHAAVAPLPEPSAAAVRRWAEEASCSGSTVWPQWAARYAEVRRQFAALLAAKPSEIALVPNTTTGAHIVAEGFPWREGDCVVFPDDEFPSNAYPWLNLAARGVVARPLATPASGWTTDALIRHLDARPRLLAISWVGYASGWRIDVARVVEAAHERGVLVFLDAIQGLGMYPLDVQSVPVDFLAADGHKWLLGPEGAGVLYIAERHLETLRPLIAGWHSVQHEHDFDRLEWLPKPTAERYEGGSQNMVGFSALHESLKLLMAYGAGPEGQAIESRLLDYVAAAAERLRGVGAELNLPSKREHRSAIVPFSVPGCDPRELRKRCLEEGIVLSVRGGRLRISPHVYNNDDDIARLVEVVATVRRRSVSAT